MLELNTSYTNHKDILDELLTGSGVVVIKDVFDTKKIEEAREIVNKFADNEDQKETHFNAEAESLSILLTAPAASDALTFDPLSPSGPRLYILCA